ncbi:nucleic acid dioxygenase ALKBH1 [Copidosoma floridanum]|uniref:nucleic acid dioxygenase ALKBH1 n=1 Tax=Copidosoma floridanum TaxID=29053 RepID=UPI0006C93DFF|nr:nucleic acid dioxygenase ALKBH1 [Copidosoma floridanum]
MFKDSFKYYKARQPAPDLKDVIDVHNSDNKNVRKITVFAADCQNDLSLYLGLKPVEGWSAFDFINIPGLLFIKNPFTPSGQRNWIVKCLKNYTKKPNILNIDAHGFLNDDKTWWDESFGAASKTDLLAKLRWATLGYHHNWDTKHYAENFKTEIPQDLKDLTSVFATALGFNKFNAEAAIINYYRMNSTLAGHTDHSEIYLEAPLFSVSFGQTAVFLIGGLKLEDPAHALLLRSGDVVVMSGNSRLRYHGVPRILYGDSAPWESNDQSLGECNDWKRAKSYISEARINLNIRQVLKPGQSAL